MATTFPAPPQATNARFPAGTMTIPYGPSGVGIRLTISRVAAS